MSDIHDPGELGGDELLAAEYALGVLAAPERDAVARRVAADLVFARLVAGWDRRLSPWAADLAEVVPPPRVWERIAARLPAEPARRAGFWQSLFLWRGLTAASALAAAGLAVLLYLGTFAPPAPLIATIEGAGHRFFVATIDARRGSVAVVPAAYVPDSTRVPELWLIPTGGKPLPLGLLRADGIVVIAISPALARDATTSAVLAVSLEPPGGSPTGQPTGPVIGTGKLTNL